MQAAEKLHADPRVLESLEAERFDELGAAVFVRGHIRRYAELVREQPQELQDLYAHSSHAVARPDLTRIPTTGSRTQDPKQLAVPGLMFVIAVGLIGVVWWFLTSLRTTTPPTASEDQNSEQGGVITEGPLETPTDATSPAATNTQSRSAQARPAAPMGPANGQGRVAATTQPRPQPAVPSSGSAATTPAAPPMGTGTAETEIPPEATTDPPAEEPPAPTGKPAEVTLRFTGDSWAEVYDARGNKLFYDIGSADSVKTLSGTPPLRVILGNPAGVAIEVNGKSATLPKVAGAENGIQFNLNRSGRVSRARAAPGGQ